MHRFLAIIALLLTPSLAPAEWQQAPKGYSVRLPQDHGKHPAQKIEWWYFTGNLKATTGQPAAEFGYQLTFFRIGAKETQPNPSPWAVRDLYMTHFAITDVTGKQYFSAQRMDRPGPGICGAAADKLHVWHENWHAKQASNDAPISLAAKTSDFGLQLQLTPTRPTVLHGLKGYSQKGATEGNASIYYSLTRVPSGGTVRVGAKEFSVSGESWMDHEFGTSFLEAGQMGWDWFSLHLSDGSDLMLFQLRRKDGTTDPNAAGTIVSADGMQIPLTSTDFTLKPSAGWKSDKTGAEYPLQWEIALPKEQLNLTVTTPVKNQEMLPNGGGAGPSYWEGTVRAAGTRAGQQITATGYLEMTGYGGQGMGQYFAP